MMMITTPTRFLCAARYLAFLLPLVSAAMPLSAQSQSAVPSPTQSPSEAQVGAQPPPRFEVASIRPHQSAGNDPSNRQILPGGRFVATATTVRTLVRIAFGTDDNRIFCAPSWIDNETFDINAITANQTEVKSPQQFQQLLLSLLEDRFQFKFHREQREASVYWLEVDKPGKLGPALKPSTPDSQPNMSNNSNGSTMTMKASKVSMGDFAAALGRQAGRPVEDHTDLNGNFDLQINWAPEEAADSAEPSLFT
ncbi:MAG TPA: TIGR03435 family protein, partial [Terracidiphilus sp.]|nr:TIGR03435 family protein [Terracidiphilus sp.]